MSKLYQLPTLLLVTGNPAVRAWIKKHLDDGFFLIYAENRREAFGALSAKLDFIIVDAAFQDCDPLELCKDITPLIKKNWVPIYLITGRLKKSYRDKARDAGVTDFLSNQLDSEELLVRIAEGKKTALAREKTADISSNMPRIMTPAGSLKNKFVLNEDGLRLLAEARAEQTPVALLVLQIDRFDPSMEQPARSLAAFVQSLLREKDVLIPSMEGRLIVLLANTPADAARAVAARLQEKIQLKALPITVSIAVSSLEPSEKGFSKMIDSAVKSFKAQSDTNLIISLDQETS